MTQPVFLPQTLLSVGDILYRNPQYLAASGTEYSVDQTDTASSCHLCENKMDPAILIGCFSYDKCADRYSIL